jgi:hypothetical protein
VDANAKNIERRKYEETEENTGGIRAGILGREMGLETPLPIADMAIHIKLRPLHLRDLVTISG